LRHNFNLPKGKASVRHVTWIIEGHSTESTEENLLGQVAVHFPLI